MIALAAAVAVVTFSPNPSHFGELVTARVQTGATPSFAPFVVRARDGSTYVLQCLDATCVPGPKRRVLTIAGTRVVVVPRATEAQVEQPLRSFRRQTAIPPPSYRIRPGPLRALLALLAAVFAAGAVALAWPIVRGLVPEERDERTPLERALALVRESLRREPRDRRRALDLLARVLGRDPRSQRALELAWSRPEPEATSVGSLVESVERES